MGIVLAGMMTLGYGLAGVMTPGYDVDRRWGDRGILLCIYMVRCSVGGTSQSFPH